MEVEREFLHRERIETDFTAIAKVNDDGLDRFIVEWATAKREETAAPAAEMLKSLENNLPNSVYVRKLLTNRVLGDRIFALANPHGCFFRSSRTQTC
jgi:Tfp pilus assembly protein PilN